ncbi:nitrilase family protein (Nit3) [Cordyceps fumosorosea ARSEF 2679]|uniref:Nitrilase family protein (Nit3) n=1 Tax=Cordyceps fumosorosea (strain ARSEF 2679) TaxID=1081104 RepID=A0A167QKD1_CORFA|nr:nitrilase family protein (Nit3) [Cordyceps fumosorosea ARSEF 2679]OAA57720.1 nitrilase family protein (Nit3) [Cordyceps fumosorosea ARSEF 2679]
MQTKSIHWSGRSNLMSRSAHSTPPIAEGFANTSPPVTPTSPPNNGPGTHPSAKSQAPQTPFPLTLFSNQPSTPRPPTSNVSLSLHHAIAAPFPSTPGRLSMSSRPVLRALFASSPSRAILRSAARTTTHRLPALAAHRPPPPPPFSTSASPAMAASYTPSPVLRAPRVTIACVQMAAGADKAANLSRAASLVSRAASTTGAKIVVLPECFNSPYGTNFFATYAEPLPRSPASQPPPADEAPSYHALAAMARDASVFLVGGSVPEREAATGRLYNTSLTFGPDGALLAAHRKVHLFDIDIPGKIAFKESEVLSAGDALTLVDLPGIGTIAVAICYDVRFPELATVAARRGAFALVYPGAFNLTTGALHWELLARARAVDNQLYVAVCSPARDMAASYHAWGHSMVVSPMAKVLAEAQEDEAIISAELVSEEIEEARRNIPLRTQRRFDVYPDVAQGKQ